MTKPPPQTKEEIERELMAEKDAAVQERGHVLTEHANRIALALFSEYTKSTEAIYIAVMVLSNLIGNTARPDNIDSLLRDCEKAIRETSLSKPPPSSKRPRKP